MTYKLGLKNLSINEILWLVFSCIFSCIQAAHSKTDMRLSMQRVLSCNKKEKSVFKYTPGRLQFLRNRMHNPLYIKNVEGFQFRWLRIKGINVVFPIWIRLIFNHLKWNSSYLLCRLRDAFLVLVDSLTIPVCPSLPTSHIWKYF